jgi:hypothetical protein
MEDIDPAPAQAGHLTQAQTAVGADRDKRAVPLVDRVGERRNLVRGQEPHLLFLDPRRLDALERTAGDDVVLDRGSENPPQRAVHLVDGRRLQPSGGEPCQRRPQHRLVKRGELHVTELRKDMEPKVVEIDASRRRPEVDERRRLFRHPVGERNP